MLSPQSRFIRYVEGSPDDIIKRGTDIKELGDKMLDCAGVLESIKSNALEYGGQEGKAIDKLRDSIGDSYETLKKAGDLYQPVGPFISAYGEELAGLQPMIRTTVDDCEELWLAYLAEDGDKNGSVVPEADGGFLGIGGYDADSPEAQEVADANRAALDAYNAWLARAEDFDRHFDSWEQAFDDAEKGISNEMAGSIEDSTWDNWSDAVSVLTEVLSWAALIVGIAAIFLVGWVAVLAVGLALLAFALTAVKYANGAASGRELLFAGLAIIPVGKVTNLAKFAQFPLLLKGAGGVGNAVSRTWKVLDKGPLSQIAGNLTRARPLDRTGVMQNLVGRGYQASRRSNISLYIGNREILEGNLTYVRRISRLESMFSRAAPAVGQYSRLTSAVEGSFGIDYKLPDYVEVLF